ncbi:MAG: ribbon-helix-helix protein, CopG family [Actinomycetota bacterium]
MDRSQIQFDSSQIEWLRKKAADEGTSISAIVRRAVTKYRAGSSSDERIERILSLGGSFQSGRKDIAERHDEYLTQDLT